MKIRTDFVTNSSSSSFIVNFLRMPVDIEDLRQMMFGDKMFFPSPWTYPGAPEGVPTLDIAATVYRDIVAQKPAPRKKDGRIRCRFRYADEDGPYFALLEHGDIFAKFEHERISHH